MICCIVLWLSFWSCSFPVLIISCCIIINFHMVCSLLVAEVLLLGISSVLVCCNVCMVLLCFLLLFYHCLLLLLLLPIYCGRFLSEIKLLIDWLICNIDFLVAAERTCKFQQSVKHLIGNHCQRITLDCRRWTVYEGEYTVVLKTMSHTGATCPTFSDLVRWPSVLLCSQHRCCVLTSQSEK